MRTVYCASVKVPQDSAAHIVGRSHDYVDGIYKMIRFVTAWAELQKNVKLDFAPGVLEIDSCRTTSQKKPVDKRKLSAKAKAACKRPASKKTYKKPSAEAQIHGGRFSWWLSVGNGRRQLSFLCPTALRWLEHLALPTAAEVLPVIGKKVISYKHIVGSDASKGLAAACKQLKVPAATARHSLSE